MMNNEKSWDTLYEKYPELFANKNKSPRESPMAFGIECSMGWYDLIESVCSMIDTYEENISYRIKTLNKLGKENDQSDLNYIPVKFDQIKEKLGGLRIYFSGGDRYVQGLVSMAEAMSYRLCEVCGNHGKPNKNGWIHTLCDKHREERSK